MLLADAGSWNSLEIARLIVSAITPIAVACVGIYIHRLTKRFEHAQWRNQKLVEKRLAIYDDLASSLNDNLCYFTYVGSWKERKPLEVIGTKRIIDKKIYLAAPLFSSEFFRVCMDFQNLCFETYTGWGLDAKLKTKFERRKEVFGTSWDESWVACFSDKVTELEKIRSAYKEIMSCFAEEIGINVVENPDSSGRVPAHVR